MALLDHVKTALRIKSTAFDNAEITPLIDACKLDLKLAGVNTISDTDPLVIRAVVLYAKANFGYSDGSTTYAQAYEMLKRSMALSGDYIAYKITFNVTDDFGNPLKGAEIKVDDALLVTNSLGKSVYEAKEQTDYEYKITCNGYKDVSSFVYVSGDTTVSVVMPSV